WSDNSTLSFLDINTSNIKPGEYIYWVEVTDENECVSADEVLIEVIGGEMILNDGLDNSTGQELIVNVSPNPARDIIIIHLENIDINSEIEIYLYTNEGVQVMDYKTRGFTKDINIGLQVGSFETGSYTIKISNGTGIIIKNIVLIN
ncbi:MAG: T9SS type A sorting domain-containing protein, partial [Bacteroidales bacterium]|nr:T9SS type A sorting domain-containing protein [Bacteroidales bacterium]